MSNAMTWWQFIREYEQKELTWSFQEREKGPPVRAPSMAQWGNLIDWCALVVKDLRRPGDFDQITDFMMRMIQSNKLDALIVKRYRELTA